MHSAGLRLFPTTAAKAALAAIALVAVIAAAALFDFLKDTLMKRVSTLTFVAVAGIALAGCQTFDLKAYADAANQLDPGCYKDVSIDVKPMIMFGWTVPVPSGSYRKTCNPDQASSAGARVTLAPGAVIGGPPAASAPP